MTRPRPEARLLLGTETGYRWHHLGFRGYGFRRSSCQVLRRTHPDWHHRPGSAGTLGFSGLAPYTSGTGLPKIIILEVCIIIGGPMLRHKGLLMRHISPVGAWMYSIMAWFTRQETVAYCRITCFALLILLP